MAFSKYVNRMKIFMQIQILGSRKLLIRARNEQRNDKRCKKKRTAN